MKRVAFAILFLTATVALGAPEKWWDSYNRGVAAVNAKNYKAAADALQSAIAQTPTEGTAVRVKNEIITYVPHFWLGIARFNLGDVDGALREWHTSEEQGAISKTEYYARLRDWVARAQAEKQRNAQSAVAAPKKSADAAISRALATQVDALSAGGDRSDSYRGAQLKLQDALNQFHKAGTDVGAYQQAEATAQQAISLFAAAAEEGKKLKAARPAVAQNRPPVQQQRVVPTPAPAPVEAKPAVTQAAILVPPPAPRLEPVTPPVAKAQVATPVESEAKVAAKIALQQFRRTLVDRGGSARGNNEAEKIIKRETAFAESLRVQMDSAKDDAAFNRIALTARDREAEVIERVTQLLAPAPLLAQKAPVAPIEKAAVLRDAYRSFAQGDLTSSEQQLTQLLGAQPTAEAFLLRGCTRYTQAMLSRTPKPLLAAAAEDFRAAIGRDRAVKLDRNAFSPKLVAFFEQVRNGS